MIAATLGALGLINALVGFPAGGDSDGAAAVLQFELAPEAAGMLSLLHVPIFKLCEEKQFRVSANQGVPSIFGNIQPVWVYKGKCACGAVCEHKTSTIASNSLWHFWGKRIAKPNAEDNVLDGEGTSSCIAEMPHKSRMNISILIGLPVQAADFEFRKSDVWLLCLRRDFGHFPLGFRGRNIGLSRFNGGLGTSLDGLGLTGDCRCLTFSLLGLVSQRADLISDSLELIVHGIRLPFSLGGQIGQIAYGGLNVGSVSGVKVRHIGNYQRAYTNYQRACTNKERQPFTGSMAAHKIAGWAVAAIATFMDAIEVAYLMAAQCGRVFYIIPWYHVFYGLFGGLICLTAVWPLWTIAAAGIIHGDHGTNLEIFAALTL